MLTLKSYCCLKNYLLCIFCNFVWIKWNVKLVTLAYLEVEKFCRQLAYRRRWDSSQLYWKDWGRAFWRNATETCLQRHNQRSITKWEFHSLRLPVGNYTSAGIVIPKTWISIVKSHKTWLTWVFYVKLVYSVFTDDTHPTNVKRVCLHKWAGNTQYRDEIRYFRIWALKSF